MSLSNDLSSVLLLYIQFLLVCRVWVFSRHCHCHRRYLLCLEHLPSLFGKRWHICKQCQTLLALYTRFVPYVCRITGIFRSGDTPAGTSAPYLLKKVSKTFANLEIRPVSLRQDPSGFVIRGQTWANLLKWQSPALSPGERWGRLQGLLEEIFSITLHPHPNSPKIIHFLKIPS